RLANVLVYVQSEELDKYRFNVPSSEVALTHKRCELVPRVLGIQVGQKLVMRSDDEVRTIHNYNVVAKHNDSSNNSSSPGQGPIERTFTNSEVVIPVRDNQHPWERAYIGVFTHPFFAVSGQDGGFRINGLPPGEYTIVAWHEKLGERTLKVTIGPKESKSVNFT